ncbi:hypothetical protein BD780_003859 [Clostridium tetanomorphum]|uniref:hypothetical protein n=1 Tax=Clostridium tetanomorphum TaxID=1553 RepID=UPI00045088A0|nr:hypothetical protein [Clostridium tetanomorphum]KAJ50734.1 hypothetical protein CTM_16477 [Clostridium tetanomorphum DSM 665]MBP1866586.1 hypothetical protein [Clostridium tetanomorphum]NRS86634.1 hypothetical protein [Clostridium tetanomorphum]SQC01750.1 Uncharacterised protein [Clostridium tetanomorphum]
MLKLKLNMLFGETVDNKEIWYCNDENTNKFYRKTLIADDNNIIEHIDEVPEELVENYIFNNKERLIKTMNL